MTATPSKHLRRLLNSKSKYKIPEPAAACRSHKNDFIDRLSGRLACVEKFIRSGVEIPDFVEADCATTTHANTWKQTSRPQFHTCLLDTRNTNWCICQKTYKLYKRISSKMNTVPSVHVTETSCLFTLHACLVWCADIDEDGFEFQRWDDSYLFCVCCIRREVTSFAWYQSYKDWLYKQNFLHEYIMSIALELLLIICIM